MHAPYPVAAQDGGGDGRENRTTGCALSFFAEGFEYLDGPRGSSCNTQSIPGRTVQFATSKSLGRTWLLRFLKTIHRNVKSSVAARLLVLRMSRVERLVASRHISCVLLVARRVNDFCVREHRTDFILLSLTLAFFVVAWGYTVGCARL